MATYYLDFEGGNDSNDGTTFANRWKTLTLGATAARIAPGDTIRVMGSPAPTSLGVNGTWTDGPLAATTPITSSTNATPIVITRAAHGLTTGDTVVITGHATNTNANGTWEVNVLTSSTFELVGSVGNGVGGATGTFRKSNNRRVMLASAVTLEVQDCGFQSGAWTQSANVVASVETTDFKEGYGSASIAIAGAFGTGLAAYKALGASTDFSGYKQISFWIKQTAGTIGAAGATQIKLCSDAAGATPVDTFDVPNLVALNQWVPVTVDKGSALGAAIQSVAFSVVTDNGAQTFLIDNITAVKDKTDNAALSLQSMIGKNSGTESWCAIQSIKGTRVMLDQGQNVTPILTTYRGYSGTTETVTAYKRETIKTDMQAAAGNVLGTLNDSGSLAGGMIAFEGGYDRTAMTTQNLETWLDGLNGFGYCISAVTKSYFSFNKMSGIRYGRFLSFTTCSQFDLDNVHANNNTVPAGAVLLSSCFGFHIGSIWLNYNAGAAAISLNSTGSIGVIDTIYGANGNSQTGILLGQAASPSWRGVRIGSAFAQNNGGNNVRFSSCMECVFNALTSKGSGIEGIAFNEASENVINDLISSGNSSGAIDASGGRNYLRNALISDATEVAFNSGSSAIIYSQKHDQTADNHRIFIDGGLMGSETSVRHTASGLSWIMQPTSAARTTRYPMVLPIAKIACEAGALVTVKAWMRRSNTGLTMRLVCKGGQIPGVSTDQAASMTVSANTWEELTITFTPSEAGVVEITAEAYGGTTYSGYVDDMTITQA